MGSHGSPLVPTRGPSLVLGASDQFADTEPGAGPSQTTARARNATPRRQHDAEFWVGSEIQFPIDSKELGILVTRHPHLIAGHRRQQPGLLDRGQRDSQSVPVPGARPARGGWQPMAALVTRPRIFRNPLTPGVPRRQEPEPDARARRDVGHGLAVRLDGSRPARGCAHLVLVRQRLSHARDESGPRAWVHPGGIGAGRPRGHPELPPVAKKVGCGSQRCRPNDLHRRRALHAYRHHASERPAPGFGPVDPDRCKRPAVWAQPEADADSRSRQAVVHS